MLQQITAVAAAINGGTLYTPYIVKSIVEPNTGEIILENKPKIVRQVLKKETSDTVKMALETVVAYGTGRNAYIEGYRVGGKTGTAQKVKNGVYMTGNYIVSFIGFLPADNPKAIVYVAIDNPKGVTQFGGTVSAPIAKNIMLDVIEELNIKQSEYTLPKTYNWYDTKYAIVPDVKNMPIDDAKKLLKDFTINYSGSGQIVKAISPNPGTYLPLKATIKLMLSN